MRAGARFGGRPLVPGQCGGEVGMEPRSYWIRSIILIAGLLAVLIALAQSRRECEVPGSSYLPCVSFKKLWKSLQ
jgi:hypothetical protein